MHTQKAARLSRLSQCRESGEIAAGREANRFILHDKRGWQICREETVPGPAVKDREPDREKAGANQAQGEKPAKVKEQDETRDVKTAGGLAKVKKVAKDKRNAGKDNV